MSGINRDRFFKIFVEQRAAALILTFMILVSLTSLTLAFLTLSKDEFKSAGAELSNMQAFYIAEAGRAKARWALTTGEEALGWGEADTSLGAGTYTVTTTDNGDGTCTITSSGYVPDDTNPIAQRQVIERDITVSTDSGPNLSLAAAASASSAQGSFTADKSNDEDSGSKWKSNVSNGSWLKHNFGSSSTFDKVVVDDGTKIDSYTIQYSTDDVVYNAVTGLSESPAWTFAFNSVAAQYLRFNVNGNKPEVNELETYNTVSGSTSLGQGQFLSSW
ncbi:discoidin domain-containing protein [Candidatus Omnitrophota bacterium]